MKILMLIGKDYHDEEAEYPYCRLMEEDIEVDIASFEKGEVYGKYHAKLIANLAFLEVEPQTYDGLVLPGGSAPEKLRQNEDVLRIVREIFYANKPVAAICHGQQILISSDVLKGKKATSYPGIRKDMENAGVLYFDEKVVVDDNLVTSRRPEDLPYFMRAFIKMLSTLK